MSAGTKGERDAAQAAARMAQRQRPVRAAAPGRPPRRDDAPAGAGEEPAAGPDTAATTAPVATETAPATGSEA